MDAVEQAKKAAGEAAADLVTDGMDIGLGTGSTTAYFIEAVGRKVREKSLRVWGVPTSHQSERLARENDIALTTFDDVDHLHLAVDGADEVDGDLNLIKGGGAAHSREKVVASQADRFVVLVDESKQVDALGTKKSLPVEVIPMAVGVVKRQLRELGAEVELRMGDKKDGPVVTDQGLWVLDAAFPDGIADPAKLNQQLNQLPGILDHGLFLGMTSDLIIGREDGTVDHLTD